MNSLREESCSLTFTSARQNNAIVSAELEPLGSRVNETAKEKESDTNFSTVKDLTGYL